MAMVTFAWEATLPCYLPPFSSVLWKDNFAPQEQMFNFQVDQA